MEVKKSVQSISIFSIFLIILLSIFIFRLQPSYAASGQGNTQNHKFNNYIVIMKDNNTGKNLFSKQKSCTVVDQLNKKTFVIRATSPKAVELQKNKAVTLVEKNLEMKNDDFNTNINVRANEKNWEQKIINSYSDSYSGSNIKIAVMDSGIDYDENIKVKRRVDFLGGQSINDEDAAFPLYDDVLGHGTAIASIIAGQGLLDNISGVAPKADIYSLRVIDQCGIAQTEDIIKAIYWAINNKINIINMSFGSVKPSKSLEKAINEAVSHGILIIASGGNTSGEKVEYPAKYSNVLSVGSVNAMGKISAFSANSPDIDILAPGESITAQSHFGQPCTLSGTSLATAYVTGVAARLMSYNHNLKSDDVAAVIKSTANKNVENNKSKFGLIDYEYAIKMTQEKGNSKSPSNVDSKQKIRANRKNIYSNGVYAHPSWKREIHEQYAVYKYMKVGALYPDHVEFIAGMTKHPTMHGYAWRMKYPVYDKGSVNYIACYKYLTKVASAYGKGNTYKSIKRKGVPGLNKTNYYEMRNILHTLVSLNKIELKIGKIKKTYKGFKKQSRVRKKAFITGFAMHTASDTFAHSAYYSKKVKGQTVWTRIAHQNADAPTYYKLRCSMAKHAQRNALLRYQGKRIVRAKVNVKVKGKKKRKTVIKIKTIPIVNDFYYKPMRTAKYYFGINKIYTFALSAGVNNKTVLKGYKKAQQTKKSK